MALRVWNFKDAVMPSTITQFGGDLDVRLGKPACGGKSIVAEEFSHLELTDVYAYWTVCVCMKCMHIRNYLKFLILGVSFCYSQEEGRWILKVSLVLFDKNNLNNRLIKLILYQLNIRNRNLAYKNNKLIQNCIPFKLKIFCSDWIYLY